MDEINALVVFQDRKIRRLWVNEEWYFSVVDVVGVLTDSEEPRKYWNKLNQRLRDERNEVVTFCHQLKMPSSDGKYYDTDCANVKGLFLGSRDIDLGFNLVSALKEMPIY